MALRPDDATEEWWGSVLADVMCWEHIHPLDDFFFYSQEETGCPGCGFLYWLSTRT
jgi:hypothetical protein